MPDRPVARLARVAPVAQGIERRPPEPGAQVRILPGAPVARTMYAAMSDPRAMHAPSGFHDDQPLDRDDLVDDPIEQFRRWLGDAEASRRAASERDDAGDGRRDRQAVGASRAAARRRRARLPVLHEPRESQGPTARRGSLGGTGFPVEGARPPGGGHGGGRPAVRRRVRRVLREPATRRAARGVGIAAERHDRRTHELSRPAWPRRPPASPAMCRAPHTGAATSFGPGPSSSGRAGATGCTTDSATRSSRQAVPGR